MPDPIVKQIGNDVWWAYVKRGYYRTGSAGQVAIGEPFERVEFEGDIFSGSNAYLLALAWRPRT